MSSNTDSARREELSACVRLNVQNELIEQVYVPEDARHEIYNLDGIKYFGGMKKSTDPIIKYLRGDTYWNFSEFAKVANELTEPGTICIVSNSDVWFDSTLSRLAEIDLNKTLVCLSKWNCHDLLNLDTLVSVRTGLYTPHKFEYAASSQDSWIFKSGNSQYLGLEVPVGTVCLERRIATKVHGQGLQTLNPMFSIISHHVHRREAEQTTYNELAPEHRAHIQKWIRNTIHPLRNGCVPPCEIPSDPYETTFVTKWHDIQKHTYKP